MLEPFATHTNCQRLWQGSPKILQLALTCIRDKIDGFPFQCLQICAQKLTVSEDSQVLVIEQRPGQAVPTLNAADTCQCLQVG